MMEVEQGGPEVRAFFAQFKRVVVIDSALHPIFRPERLSLYFRESEAATIGSYQRVVFEPRQRALGDAKSF